MSYAIVRNEKLTRNNANGAYIHNDRKTKGHTNKDIDATRTHLNYYFKKNEQTYIKEFDKLRKERNLQGHIRSNSIIMCEMVFTSDQEFFDKIGEKETRRYFEECYKFMCNYKNLGEENIISCVTHLDETVPHMHLIYVPVVYTKDKDGKDIEKICCRDFWRARDCYRQLQNDFYAHITSKGFTLERGLPVEETGAKHEKIEDLKRLTNFAQTKKVLENIKLELPDVPEIADINVARWSKKRDEKILEEIIKPKDDLIQNLYQNNLDLHRELTRQAQVIEEAEKYQKERDKILADNEELHNSVKIMKKEYKKKSNTLDLQFSNRKRDLEIEFKEKESQLKSDWMDIIDDYKKENKHLKRLVETFKKTIKIFIKWICKKFNITEDYSLIRDFERETRISLDAEKQVQKEDREKEGEYER
ncbi:MAG: plasmid recombination protein [Clostridia bacterium]|nr:plasmid recombination protein [Clostridia bacterium]